MLRVRTKLGVSPIHGIGLFADQDIKKGERVHKWDDGVEPAFKNPEIFSPIQREFIETYGYMENGKVKVCLDNARFMNHSLTPNTCEEDNGTYARRDIIKGEELTCDYKDFGCTEDDLKWNFNQ